ncbi:microfibril-associated glycoprotein 4-like [Clytia hemisphaerica]|uniref:Fibrinogen C-terminal domain-containing protein n=1 Tax=Clytia hemisphaerica TaxID=252671 RepID=A0A7M5WRD0_9CNID
MTTSWLSSFLYFVSVCFLCSPGTLAGKWVPFEFVGRNAAISGPPTWFEMEAVHYDFCFKKCLVIKCHYVEFLNLSASGDIWSCKLYGIVKKVTDYLVSKIGSKLYKAVNQYKDCDSWLQSGYKTSGVYEITFDERLQDVYCEMDVTKNKGWIIIQKRFDGSVDFDRLWTDYKNGFGNVEGEYWLGLENIHKLTDGRHMNIKLEAHSFQGQSQFAVYKNFSIENEANFYRLHAGVFDRGFVSDPDNWLIGDNMEFSTVDKDRDIYQSHCAANFPSGWWHKSCFLMNFNGVYRQTEVTPSFAQGIVWKSWIEWEKSLKSVSMAVRRLV